MKLHEYQAKELLLTCGLSIPNERLVFTPQEASEAFLTLKCSQVVIKAQIHAGGRGKGGGVRTVTSSDEAFIVSEAMLNRHLITPQTSSSGLWVSKLLVCEDIYPVKKELYLSLTMDQLSATLLFILSKEGGMEIETLAKEQPDKIVKLTVDPAFGWLYEAKILLGEKLELNDAQAESLLTCMEKMYQLFKARDLSLLEINPLCLTKNDKLVAVDAKISVDDNARFRQPELVKLYDAQQEDDYEQQANAHHLHYVALEGNIGCLVNGAGLAMATMDLIKACGGSPANFLDIGGDATKERVFDALQLLLDNPRIDKILLNIFGGIIQCDMIAEAIILALKGRKGYPPIVIRLEGNQADVAYELLFQANLGVHLQRSLREAAAIVVALS